MRGADCRKNKGDDKYEFLAKCGSSITIFLQVSAPSYEGLSLGSATAGGRDPCLRDTAHSH